MIDVGCALLPVTTDLGNVVSAPQRGEPLGLIPHRRRHLEGPVVEFFRSGCRVAAHGHRRGGEIQQNLEFNSISLVTGVAMTERRQGRIEMRRRFLGCSHCDGVAAGLTPELDGLLPVLSVVEMLADEFRLGPGASRETLGDPMVDNPAARVSKLS